MALIVMAAATAVQAQPGTSSDMTFQAKERDLGNLVQGIPATANYQFTNSGNAPLILTDVQPSCGCVTVESPRQLIAPGKVGVIRTTYNAASVGTFQKTITIVSNSAVSRVLVLTIRGQVYPPPPSAPAKTPAQPAPQVNGR